MSKEYVITKSSNKLKKWTAREVLPKKEDEEKKAEPEQFQEDKPKKCIYKKKKEEDPNKIKYGKPISFGASGYRDYTLMQDGDPKEAEHIKKIYINRHKKKENWDDPTTSGFWAGNLLWNKPTMEESAKDIKERYNINVTLDI